MDILYKFRYDKKFYEDLHWLKLKQQKNIIKTKKMK